MNILDKIRADLRALGYKTQVNPIGARGDKWRVLINLKDDINPVGYYYDFDAEKFSDTDYVAQYLIIMYLNAIKSVLNREEGDKSFGLKELKLKSLKKKGKDDEAKRS